MLIKLLTEKNNTNIFMFNYYMIIFLTNIFAFIISDYSSILSVFLFGFGFAGMLIRFPTELKIKDIPKESYLNFKELFCFFTIKK